MSVKPSRSIEWPTFFLVVGCYLAWGLGTGIFGSVWWPLGVLVTTLTITLHSSLQHEVLHGHPFRSRLLNEALVFLPLGLIIPYGRFRDTHLEHHRDELLTDPYDDPESNYLDPVVWAGLSTPHRILLRYNNTLLGRLTVGPGLTAVRCVMGDFRAIRAGDKAILRDWLLHLVGLVIVIWLVHLGEISAWAYCLSAYMGLAILKIRTFLEHRAHTLARARTVVIEGGYILPFLFLNNNLHTVHHAKPQVAWYRLPALYRANRAEYLRRNDGYSYASYAEVFRRYFLRPKDPVPHPLWRKHPPVA
jgi:fatty acid desaturase